MLKSVFTKPDGGFAPKITGISEATKKKVASIRKKVAKDMKKMTKKVK